MADSTKEGFLKTLQAIIWDAHLFDELFYAIRIVLQKQNISIHFQADEGAWIVIDSNGETGDVSKFHELKDAIAWAFKEESIS